MTNKEIKAYEKELLGYLKKGQHNEAMRLVSSLPDMQDDPMLSFLTIRVILDAAEISPENEFLADGAATLLEGYDNYKNTAEWHLLMGRARYISDRYLQAYHELVIAQQLCNKTDSEQLAAEIDELAAVCLADIEKLSAFYSKVDLNRVITHIDEYFGTLTAVVRGSELANFGNLSPELHIYPDIFMIEPTKERNWRTFVTFGSGAKMMNVPRELQGVVSPRCEYVMYLPADWELDDCKWALNLMMNLALLPKLRNSFATVGHIFSDGSPITDDTELIATMLIDVQDVPESASQLTLSDGSVLEFYQLFPIYREEFEFKLEKGYSALIDKMPHISAVFDLHRENVCKNDAEEPAEENVLLAPEYDYTGKMNVGIFCAVSRKIVEDGAPVGYMRRFCPDSSTAPSDTDSGWLFLAGTESPGALMMPTTITVARINTVCNIDPAIVRYLNSPYNSILVRVSSTRFMAMPPDSDSDLPMS